MVQFNKAIQIAFDKISDFGKLYRSKISGRELWKIYLDSFDEGDDPTFRDPESSTHNCNNCNSFIRRYGNIVAINDENEVVTMFDLEIEGEFKPVAEALSNALKNAEIEGVFMESYDELKNLPYQKVKKTLQKFQLGIDKNVKQYSKEESEVYGKVEPEQIFTFNHLHLNIDRSFIDFTGSSLDSISANYRDAKNVFMRGMREISIDTLNLVRDLINQGSLLDGNTHLFKINALIPLKLEFDNLDNSKKDAWCWRVSYDLNIAKFRNELIGVLCTELTEGEDVNTACKSWNKRVDPINYMKATAPITSKQIEEAKEFVQKNGYEDSFKRRLATLDDIKTSEIKHINTGDGSLKSVSVFDGVKSTKSQHKRNEFDNVEVVGIEKFITDILPSCDSVSVYVKNHHEGNMVSLTTSDVEDSKEIFKWKNNYSWTFNGNLAGKSLIKDAVKNAGGDVNGVLNFRLLWNDIDSMDGSDLDAWAIEPNQTEIGYSAGYRRDQGGKRTSCSGQLDIDNMNPNGKIAVENITWNDLSKMKDGSYNLFVHQYDESNSQGFKAEIEFDGNIYTYCYDKPLRRKQKVSVATVHLKNGVFSITHLLPELNRSKEIYGLETNQFHTCNLICLSPNHWANNSVGNKHFLFMIDGCKTENKIRGFHNENLIPGLLKHRKVIEVLGNTNMIEPNENQLSGLGFNSTIPDELIVKLTGNFKRIIKLKF